MLSDSFGRGLTGIRVSLTDRCNFDCVYCHNEGLGDTRGPMEAADDELSTDEVVRILEVAAEVGVTAAKFTGGEPMLREDLEEIVRRTPDSMETSITTNGTFLPGRAEALADAGLDRVNVSQDALDPDAFAELTKSGAYDRVLEGVQAALDAGLAPVKLNMVVFEPTAGYVPGMVEHVAENDGLQLQLIEYMPELAGHPEWAIDIERVHNWLEEQAFDVERREMHARRRYWIDGGERSDGERGRSERDPHRTAERSEDGSRSQPERRSDAGMVEVVDPVGNAEFCANCERVRVTHDGYLKGCLNRNDDLKSMGDCTREEIREALERTVAERVPYYGEYMVRDGDGGWKVNEKYLDSEGDRAPYEYTQGARVPSPADD